MKLIKAGLCLVFVLAAGQALAINKCTSPDGKVVFQDAPCTNSQKAESLKITSPIGASDKQWSYTKEKDQMTGKTTCFVQSPSVWVRGVKGVPNVYLLVAMRGDVQALTVRGETSTDLLHNQLDGMGVKVDENGFIKLTRKINATTVGFSAADQTDLLTQLSNGKQIRARVRFWPWDALGDSEPLSLIGFKQAYALAMQCSKSA
jgi:hypothetical protein